MATPGAQEGPEVEGNSALVRIETDPWAILVPVFLGDSKEEEEVHWVVLSGFGNLPERSLKMALHILTKIFPMLSR
jgi:hypothetical protein